ncbi:Retrovirus-related Pol polyprotein from transposon opus [Echinococcus granulosus]|uniref:Retrovirus-related Pol polyprotein from transposon opus n=1 Tax=Echinococcus granulosus TaxID=6210 RepID=W6UJ80_ECHGR|nr:Retrovirus-related Pol polyprotein from transposon opus [Echinococcus granulosus]EUB61540.1 Retrovirus-related Pol polyprotein from transposon opus [Echinococcus granulosus]
MVLFENAHIASSIECLEKRQQQEEVVVVVVVDGEEVLVMATVLVAVAACYPHTLTNSYFPGICGSERESQCRYIDSATYYRRFVKGYAKIASPQHKLTKKQTKRNFNWAKEHDEVFYELEQMLCSARIPAMPHFGSSALPFALNTDTSDAGVGGITSQRTIEGMEHVIAYTSGYCPYIDCVSPFKMFLCYEMRVPSDMFLPSTEIATNNVPEYVVLLKEGRRQTLNIARKPLKPQYIREKYYGKHSQTDVYREGEPVQLFRPNGQLKHAAGFDICGG